MTNPVELLKEAPGTLRKPGLKWEKDDETGAKPVYVVAVEIDDLDPEDVQTLAMYAIQGHQVQVTVTAQQGRL